MTEQIAQVPFLEQVAAELQQSGEYRRQLSAIDVKDLTVSLDGLEEK